MPASKRWFFILMSASALTSCVVRAHPVVVVRERPEERVEVAEVRESPPPLRAEVAPAAPHPDCIWITGHWVRTGRGWDWEAGYWVRRPHARAVWVPGHWKEVGPGVWRWVPGHWQQ